MQRTVFIKWCTLLRPVHKTFLEKGKPGRLGPGVGWRGGGGGGAPLPMHIKEGSRVGKENQYLLWLCIVPSTVCTTPLYSQPSTAWQQILHAEHLDSQPSSPWLQAHLFHSDCWTGSTRLAVKNQTSFLPFLLANYSTGKVPSLLRTLVYPSIKWGRWTRQYLN